MGQAVKCPKPNCGVQFVPNPKIEVDAHQHVSDEQPPIPDEKKDKQKPKVAQPQPIQTYVTQSGIAWIEAIVNGKIEKFYIQDGKNTIGRKDLGFKQRPTIAIELPVEVSRFHCCIEKIKRQDGFEWLLYDNNVPVQGKKIPFSNWGVFLDGKRLDNEDQIYVKHGDMIGLGKNIKIKFCIQTIADPTIA